MVGQLRYAEKLGELGVAVVDSHMHQWDPFTTPREASLLAKVVRKVPAAEPLLRFAPKRLRELLADPAYVLRPYLPVDYAADCAGVPVRTAVHVQAEWHGKGPFGSVGETRWLAGLNFAGANPAGIKLGAIVPFADPASPVFGDVLDAHLGASALVRGIRCMGSHHPDGGVHSWAPRAGVLVQPGFLRGFGQLAARNLSFEAYVYSHQLGDVVTLAREYPDVTIVLDHYATPVGAFGPVGNQTGRTEEARRGLLDRWRDDISAVAALPNVVAKHSGIGFPLLGFRAPGTRPPLPRTQVADAVGPLVRFVLEAFGAERSLWGSNFPMDKPIAPLPVLVDIVAEIVAERGETALEQVFSGTATRVYRLGGA